MCYEYPAVICYIPDVHLPYSSFFVIPFDQTMKKNKVVDHVKRGDAIVGKKRKNKVALLPNTPAVCYNQVPEMVLVEEIVSVVNCDEGGNFKYMQLFLIIQRLVIILVEDCELR